MTMQSFVVWFLFSTDVYCVFFLCFAGFIHLCYLFRGRIQLTQTSLLWTNVPRKVFGQAIVIAK